MLFSCGSVQLHPQFHASEGGGIHVVAEEDHLVCMVEQEEDQGKIAVQIAVPEHCHPLLGHGRG